MDFKDIATGLLPIQTITSDLAPQGSLGVLPQIASGLGEGEQMGLMGFLSPQFLGGGSSGPSPEQAYRDQYSADQFLTGGGMQGQGQGQAQGQRQMDPLAMLDANINRRFGM